MQFKFGVQLIQNKLIIPMCSHGIIRRIEIRMKNSRAKLSFLYPFLDIVFFFFKSLLNNLYS